MRLLTTSLFLFCSLVLFGQQLNLSEEERTWIESHPEVIYAFSPEWKPFEIVDNKEYVGISRDFLDIVSKKTGIQFRGIYHESWDKCLDSYKEKRIQLIPCLIYTDERNSYMALSKSYAESPVVIVTRKDAKYIQSLDYLSNKTLAMPKDYSHTEYIEQNYPNIKLIKVKNTQEALNAVSTGKADATIDNLPIVSYYMYYEGYQNLKIAAPVNALSSVKLHMAVQQEDSILLGILNKAIADIYPKDKNAIFSKWVSVKHDQSEEVKRVILYAVIGFIVLMGLIIYIVLVNKKLKVEIGKRQQSEKDLERTLGKLAKKNQEKSLLLKEVHHRVKNNLQILNSLFSLQSENLDPTYQDMCREAQNKVITMAMLHEKLYESPNPNAIEVDSHFSLLGSELINSFVINRDVEFETAIFSFTIDAKTAVSLGLILNELITNSMKYAFNGIANPKVFFGLKRLNNNSVIEFVYIDNGIGLPESVLEENDHSLGMSLVKTLTEQIEGNLELIDVEGAGFRITFPYNFKDA